MSKLNISTRLAFSFGLIIVLLAIVAFVSVSRIRNINASTEKILNDRYVKVMLSNTIQSEINIQARLLGNAIIGANVWLIHSVAPNAKVYNQEPKPLIKV